MRKSFISLLFLVLVGLLFINNQIVHAQEDINNNPNNEINDNNPNNGIDDNNFNDETNNINDNIDNNQNGINNPNDDNIDNNTNNGNGNLENDEMVEDDNMVENMTYGLGGAVLGSAVTFLLLRRRTM